MTEESALTLPVQNDIRTWLRMLEAHAMILAELRKALGESCTLSRFELLVNLEREDGQTLAALSRKMLVTAGNITGLAARARRDGLIVRRSDAGDKRLSRVYLTAKGRTLLRTVTPRHHAHLASLFASLSTRDKTDLLRIITKLRDGLRDR